MYKGRKHVDLDKIDPYSNWTRQDKQPPLFTENEILDFERHALEDTGAIGDIVMSTKILYSDLI